MGMLYEYCEEDLTAKGLAPKPIEGPGDILARPKEHYEPPVFRGLTLEEVADLQHHEAQRRAEAWLMANAPKTDPCASPEVLLDETGDEYEPTQVDGRAIG